MDDSEYEDYQVPGSELGDCYSPCDEQEPEPIVNYSLDEANSIQKLLHGQKRLEDKIETLASAIELLCVFVLFCGIMILISVVIKRG